ncbi:MAG: PaaI family thioesterase [Desulfobulbus sp.]
MPSTTACPSADGTKPSPAIQDGYPDLHAHCYGCGRLNPDGWQLKSYVDGEETVCRFTPDGKYTGGVPGFAYGGLLAALIDCHSAATAAAAGERSDSGEPPRFVTASLRVDYRKPTPLTELEIRGRVRSVEGRKVTVEAAVIAAGQTCVTATVLLVRMREQTTD